MVLGRPPQSVPDFKGNAQEGGDCSHELRPASSGLVDSLGQDQIKKVPHSQLNQPSERGSFSKEETRFEADRGDIRQIFLEIEAVLQHFSQGRNAYIVIV